MNYITKTPTRAQAKQVAALVRKKYGLKRDETGPELRMNFDWQGTGAWTAIVWEGGPYDWAVECSFDLLPSLPKGVWLEPVTSWSMNIYVDKEVA